MALISVRKDLASRQRASHLASHLPKFRNQPPNHPTTSEHDYATQSHSDHKLPCIKSTMRQLKPGAERRKEGNVGNGKSAPAPPGEAPGFSHSSSKQRRTEGFFGRRAHPIFMLRKSQAKPETSDFFSFLVVIADSSRTDQAG